MESFIFTVRHQDVESLNEAMKVWSIDCKPHVTLAFDSATPPEWVQVIVNGITSPAAMSCLSAAIGYFVGRNKGKKLEVHTKDGAKVIVEGFSQAETTALLNDSIGQIVVKENKPT
ncbi:TPA: hypothetical protein ACMVL8_002428 [Yersinia enterocolitica]|uniref:hypothetical protein n=1 Tax=Yersinia enterocolitica TaxID=630 RepID=UPI0027EE3D0E|nr:hypothetical protein [Yersinia enterocolitica]EKN4765927.1 hypothetical protein [Yersinia enterocolitica]EKN4811351.1 hypothetical protein [Yersinia enterocolitica]EKN6369243.1 hypothetical protein [Yersinia enterocolitica]HDL6480489.1 hypothetical protein [Yersinia enterocolitica]